jgi:hypothetical protein
MNEDLKMYLYFFFDFSELFCQVELAIMPLSGRRNVTANIKKSNQLA